MSYDCLQCEGSERTDGTVQHLLTFDNRNRLSRCTCMQGVTHQPIQQIYHRLKLTLTTGIGDKDNLLNSFTKRTLKQTKIPTLTGN